MVIFPEKCPAITTQRIRFWSVELHFSKNLMEKPTQAFNYPVTVLFQLQWME